MKITLKIGKREQTVKVKTTEDLGKIVYILHGQILKKDIMPDIADEKFTCKIDGEKIEPKRLLLILKDKLKEATKSSDKGKKDKGDKEVKKKKDKSKKSEKKKKDSKDKVKSKDKKKKQKQISLDFNESKSDDNGCIHLHRIR